MLLVLARVGSRLTVFMATHIAGSASALDIYFKTAALISVPTKTEPRLNIGVQLDQTGLALIAGAVYIMAGCTQNPSVLHMRAVKPAERIGLCQNALLIVAHPTQAIVGVHSVSGLIGVRDKLPAQQGVVRRAMGVMAMGAARGPQPFGMSRLGKV